MGSSANDALVGMSAFVTGGAGGIGGASARWLARDGASVTIMGRTEEKLRNTVKELDEVKHKGAVMQYIVGDASVGAEVKKGIEFASAPTGTLNMCVATVGGGTTMPFLMMTEEVYLGDLRTNMLPPFLAIKYAAPVMAANGGGSIVLISSDSARMSWPNLAAYCAGKAGLEAMMRVAADELGHLQVRVNAVRPGLVRAGSSSRMFEDKEALKKFVVEKPLGRTGVPDDIAAGVRYLAGPESSWVTGQSFAIEGGDELRKAPNLEDVVRRRYGDDAVDATIAGRIPNE
ncbi:MAG: SDR family oxidoreductase [Actinobacteria bacterium]|nr:MAG: SDR family oxidoreductase [Actinomycetota bacterium]